MSEKRCGDCEHFGLSKDPIFRLVTGICGRYGKEVGCTDKCLFEEERDKDEIIEDLKAEDKRLNQVIIDKCQEIAILKQDNERQRFIIDQQQDIMILLFRLLEIYNDREAILH